MILDSLLFDTFHLCESRGNSNKLIEADPDLAEVKR